ncbi:helix-turn-helix domain-containing protein [Agrobacterium radiobacter]|uniref:helix-turn-helix domain-containing protein n=1 Tax=Agrobacterium radiobacter TaxID=362 RepID=UPI003F861689
MEKDSRSVEKSVGDAIRQKRLAKGLSQSALGEKVALTFQQIQKYEKGISKVSATKLVEIADALDSDVRSFFHEIIKSRILGSVEPPRPQDDAKDMKSYRDAMILSSAFLTIQDEQVRRNILQLVQVIATGGKQAGRPARAGVKSSPVKSTP